MYEWRPIPAMTQACKPSLCAPVPVATRRLVDIAPCAVGGAHVDPIVLTLQGPLHGMPAASIARACGMVRSPLSAARGRRNFCVAASPELPYAGAAIA